MNSVRFAGQFHYRVPAVYGDATITDEERVPERLRLLREQIINDLPDNVIVDYIAKRGVDQVIIRVKKGVAASMESPPGNADFLMRVLRAARALVEGEFLPGQANRF